jgi:hypothetical protein
MDPAGEDGPTALAGNYDIGTEQVHQTRSHSMRLIGLVRESPAITHPESLVVPHRNAAEAIDHGGLGRAELDPFRAIQLHGFVKLF